MLAEALPMVRGDGDKRLLAQPQAVEMVQEQADAVVRIGDLPIVARRDGGQIGSIAHPALQIAGQGGETIGLLQWFSRRAAGRLRGVLNEEGVIRSRGQVGRVWVPVVHKEKEGTPSLTQSV